MTSKFKIKSIGSSSILTAQICFEDKDYTRMIDYFTEAKAEYLESSKGILFGDQSANDASLHLRPDFEALTAKVEFFARKYLLECGYDGQNLELFHQKAWPVIIHSDGKVKAHSHPNADLSVIFCLQTDLDSGGNIVFDSDDDYLKPGLVRGKALRGHLRRSVYGLKPLDGLLMVFPSKLKHFVSEYKGVRPMLCVSYDISIVGAASLGTGDSENFVVHPAFWREFSPPEVASSTAKKHLSIRTGLPSQHNLDAVHSFELHGYCQTDSFLPSSVCNALLKEIIHCWGLGSRSFIKGSEYRLHVPLPLSDNSLLAIRKICSSYHCLLDQFLSSEEDQFLVELSSITSFPGARQQEIHRDYKDFSRNLITFFVNLLPAGPAEGSIGVIPGSHLNADEFYTNESCQFLNQPAGSIIAMDGSLAHAGGANISESSIRPVWYCTFGSNELIGPTYSIKENLRGRYKYVDFLGGRP